ncbi:MAG: NYN domain-containing protein [Candidatus Falkowbacteria bacterium]
MHFIIDANNLAGKLKMLGLEDFDRKLIDMIREFNRDRGISITLVFDGRDRMGDKVFVDPNLTVIYSPKDDYYHSADDKIVEMVRGSFISGEFAGAERGIVVVTDDNLLRQRLEAAAGETRYGVKLERSTDWAERILWKKSKQDGADDSNGNKGGLSDDEINKLNERLRKIWK